MHRIILEMLNKVIQGKCCHDRVSRTLVTQGDQWRLDLPRDACAREIKIPPIYTTRWIKCMQI
ncbi:hypothetical protein Sjap_025066 [Stephania japonica]|uniref:Uncharacterized protein n=1 Tax=Stephania japonica TaxID=461633 RepID=A0AAP0E0Y3_9MAGN